MRTPGDRPDTPAQLRTHAATLRDCAKRAQAIAAALGPFLDKPTQAATASNVWLGRYAQDTTSDLTIKQQQLHQMAECLLADARGWTTAADQYESDATDIERAKAAHP